MYMNKFLVFMGLFSLLAGCGGNKTVLWSPSQNATTNPTDVQDAYLYSTSLYGSDDGGKSANIAVLLPMKGSAKNAGESIKTSIETAFLRKPKSNIKISFYDLSGNSSERTDVINHVLSTNPDAIIGPLFAEDARYIRDRKKSSLPVVSFTSDITALGDNVVSVNLIPTQSIEAIIRQIQQDGGTNIVVLAPNDNSGKMMASVAAKAIPLYDMSLNGLFYYDAGKPDSIKDVAMRASMFSTRNAANTRAREILSDILTKESLTAKERSSLNKQLEKISRTETTGKLPYDAILFLGTGEDSKTITSFLRYYGVGSRDVAMYGTTLWHGSDIATDLTLAGAKYATLPEISDNFVSLYSMVSGQSPDYLSAFGYDAANLTLGLLFTSKSQDAYLYDPSGYIGTTGIFRIQPNGEDERGLRIMELNGTETVGELKSSPTNFITPLYNVNNNNLRTVSEKALNTRGVNPGDYITIPEHLRKKSAYRTKTIGANYVAEETDIKSKPIQIFAESEKEVISDPEFQPVKIESIERKNIDSIEIAE